MAQTIGEAVLEVGADMSDFGRDVDKGATTALAGTTKKSESEGKKGGKLLGGGLVAGLGKAIAPLGAALGAIEVGGFIKDSIGLASDLNESLNALDVTYGKNSKQIKALGDTAATSFGLSQLELNNFAVQFSGFATQLQGDGKTSADVFETVMGRATDFASVMNLDVAEAAEVFQSALSGETEPIKKFGINLSAAAVEAYAVKNGLAEAGKEMSDQTKLQATYGLLMEKTAFAQGDFANTSGGLANQQKILGARWAELKTTLGSALLPAMTAVMTFLNNLLGPALEWVTGLLGGEGGGGLGGAATGVGQAFQGFMTWLQPIIEIFKQLGAELGERLGPAFTALKEVFVSQVIPAIQSFIAFVGQIYTALQPVYEFLASVFSAAVVAAFDIVVAVVKAAWQVFSGLLDFIVGVFTGDWEKAWGGIQQIFGALVELVMTLAGTLWTFLKNVFSAGLKAVKGLWTNGWNAVKKFFSNLGTSIRNIASNLWTAVKTRFTQGLISIASGVNSRLKSIRTYFSNMGTAIRTTVSNAFKRLVSTAKDRISSLVTTVKGLPGKIKNAVGNLGSLLYQAGRNVIQGLIDGIRSMVYNVGSSMGNIAATIRSYLPFSPAKTGPLSGSGNPENSGRKIASMVGDGLELGAADVANSMRGVLAPLSAQNVGRRLSPAASMVGSYAAPAAAPEAAAGPVSAGVTVNQNYYGPTTGSGRLREMDWTLRYATNGRQGRG